MKKRLLFVVNDLSIGGPQKGLLAILDKLDYSRVDATILLLHPEGLLREHINPHVRILEADPLVTASTLPATGFFRHLVVMLKFGHVDMFLSAIACLLRKLILKKNMNQERQSFWLRYHGRFPSAPGQYDKAFAVMFGLTTYFVVDCVDALSRYYWIINDYRDVNLNKEIDEYYLRKMDGSLSDSEQCTRIFVEFFPFMRGKVTLFYNLIPTDFYGRVGYGHGLLRNETSTKIISVCRLDPLKGIDMAIDACFELKNQGFDVKWYVLGDGKEKGRIMKMINARGLSDTFILLGFQLNTLSFLQQCDIFVHPTRAEGKSIAVDEAKFVGMPIVTTDYPVVSEQVEDGITGIICKMDYLSIADSVARLLTDHEFRRRLSANCSHRLDNSFDVTDFFERLT